MLSDLTISNFVRPHVRREAATQTMLAKAEAAQHLPLHSDLFRHPPPRLNPGVPYGRRHLTTLLAPMRAGVLNGMGRTLQTARWWLIQQVVNLGLTCHAVTGPY